ncbi:MAG: glycoside hydrolase, family 5 [Bryobacterales bacterium]|nr:glycoside hydrolase, family 5 [Bryobacterales bacterium]
MHLSHQLAPLSVLGNRIVNTRTRDAVTLRGVNRSGLEYSSPAHGNPLINAGITEREITEIVEQWGLISFAYHSIRNGPLRRPDMIRSPIDLPSKL